MGAWPDEGDQRGCAVRDPDEGREHRGAGRCMRPHWQMGLTSEGLVAVLAVQARHHHESQGIRFVRGALPFSCPISPCRSRKV